ncbi:Aminopeptidase 2 [Paenibacillus sp. P1XP2]|nr:Aminopeptidase 2 [Paenibacillus sp. P1XP2]
MASFLENLNKYADLAVRVGVNVQQGQILVVNAPVESAEFVRMITEKAYQAGASEVRVNWNDEKITRLKYEHAADEVFSEAPKWYAGEMTELAERGAAILHVLAEIRICSRASNRSGLRRTKKREAKR